MIFDSTATYISTDELSMAVDAAVKLERPLLVKGEPGTGKTLLAEEVANSLGMELVQQAPEWICGLRAVDSFKVSS